MSKYFQFLLATFYALLVIGFFFTMIRIFGWLHKPVRDAWILLSILGWILVCLLANYFLTRIFLGFEQVRKPIREEEQRLQTLLSLILQKTGDHRQYHLLIDEQDDINAAAAGYRTIIVTTGLLEEMPDREIEAVLAHELGHLNTWDTAALMIFRLTHYLPERGARLLSGAWKHGNRSVRFINSRLGWLGLAAAGFVLYYFHILKYAGALLCYLLVITLLQYPFAFLWRLVSRYTEYRQDAFAEELGYGQTLRLALVKLMKTTPRRVDYFSIVRSGHPFLHNRIRRLEKRQD